MWHGFCYIEQALQLNHFQLQFGGRAVQKPFSTGGLYAVILLWRLKPSASHTDAVYSKPAGP